MNLIVLKSGNYPNAVCVDGTPAGFIFRRGQGDGANKWVLALQGGGACTSVETCSQRNKRLISIITWRNKSTEELSGFMDGIFNPSEEKNPHFYNWNHVFFIYCSADRWSGQRVATTNTDGLNWTGRYVIEAVINSLLDKAVIGFPTLSSAEDILFTGSSSGAAGVVSNIDWLGDFLQSKQVNAKFKGVLDSGVGPLSPLDDTFAIPSESWSLYNSVINEACYAAHVDSGDLGKCAFTEYLIVNDYLSSPLFVYHDQSDATLIKSYGTEVEPRIQKIISALPNAFSPNLGNHLLITVPEFYTMAVKYPSEFMAGYENGLYLEAGVDYTYSDLLWLWYSQETD